MMQILLRYIPDLRDRGAKPDLDCMEENCRFQCKVPQVWMTHHQVRHPNTWRQMLEELNAPPASDSEQEFDTASSGPDD